MMHLSHKPQPDLVLGKVLIAHLPDPPTRVAASIERAALLITVGIVWSLLAVLYVLG